MCLLGSTVNIVIVMLIGEFLFCYVLCSSSVRCSSLNFEFFEDVILKFVFIQNMNTKEPACSCIKSGVKVHAFGVKDESHLTYFDTTAQRMEIKWR
ncbi:hypothetical protein QVD17_22606 [Tagetes erecta]|uniref:Uncharacterized protein n=1 Tax=Tagetes erecta TaxID=13708 RepID=A0AAD8KFQ8_TARER|nr:hypothetical protein QVD17_22606 [Tagetes erecta]